MNADPAARPKAAAHSGSNAPKRTMLLTGASRGIGHATVMQFAMAGWRILSCSRQAFSEKCPWPSGADDHIQIDLGAPEDTMRGIAEIKKRLAAEGGKLHALVNNAGISPKGSNGQRLGAATTSFNDWHKVFQVNFFAPIMLARGLLGELTAGKGAIENGYELFSFEGFDSNVATDPAGTYVAQLKAALAATGAKGGKGTIGIETRFLPFVAAETIREVLPGWEIIDIEPALKAARWIKTAREIEKLR